jgi:Ca2+-binding RTX toxin-like protein
MRKVILLLATMALAILLAAGAALAANIQCQGDPCVGTEQNDRITGSLEDDVIEALGGRDHVTGRGGDDEVYGGRRSDEITGGDGGDDLTGDRGPDEIRGGPGTPDDTHTIRFNCTLQDPSTLILITTDGYQRLSGDDGNDLLAAGRDNDCLLGGAGRNDLSGNGGSDCLVVFGDENERVSGGDGDDIVMAWDANWDDIFCGAGHDTVSADAEDRVATDCEDVFSQSLPPGLQAPGTTPEAEVSITAPEDIGS